MMTLAAIGAVLIAVMVAADYLYMRQMQRRVDTRNKQMEAEWSTVMGVPPEDPPPERLQLR